MLSLMLLQQHPRQHQQPAPTLGRVTDHISTTDFTSHHLLTVACRLRQRRGVPAAHELMRDGGLVLDWAGLRRGQGRGGQGEGDAQAVRVAGGGGYRAVVRGGHRGHDGQAQAGAGAPGRYPGPVEPVEDAGQLFRRDTRAVVADVQHHLASAPGDGDGGGAAVGGVRGHVAQNVVDGPAEQFLVPGDLQATGDVAAPGPVRVSGAGPLHALGGQRAEIDWLALLLIGALAGLLPALKAARLAPTEALWTL